MSFKPLNIYLSFNSERKPSMTLSGNRASPVMSGYADHVTLNDFTPTSDNYRRRRHSRADEEEDDDITDNAADPMLYNRPLRGLDQHFVYRELVIICKMFEI